MEIQRAAEFGWVIGLFILLSFVADVIKKQRQRRAEERERLLRPPPRRLDEPVTVTGSGNTQAEGRTLDQLLRGLEQVLTGEEPVEAERLPPMTKPRTPVSSARVVDQARERGRVFPASRTGAKGPGGRKPDRLLEGHEEVEERHSLEVDPEVRSLEVGGRSRDVRAVDLDDSAEATIQRRLTSVAARNRAHTKVDHQKFHQKVDQQPADATRVGARRYSAKEMQRAFVWREILGPPKGME